MVRPLSSKTLRALSHLLTTMFSRVFPDKLNCNDLGDKLTDDFATVGHLVLHEYT